MAIRDLIDAGSRARLEDESPNNMEKNEKRGLAAARVIRCIAQAKGSAVEALHHAKQQYGENGKTAQTIRKALAAGDTQAGGFLIPPSMQSEVIDLLRPLSVVRAMGPRIVNAPTGTTTFPKITAGATASYIGENTDIPVSEPQFGEVVLEAKKLVGLVPISNDLLRFSPQSADEAIRNDLVEAIATTEDRTLITGDGSQNTPKGLRNLAASANVTATNGTSATNIEDDFKDLIDALDSSDVRLRNPVWLMHPSRKNHLLNLRDANGNLIYPEIRTRQPTVHGWPVMTTTNITSGATSEVYFVEPNEVLFGEVDGMMVDVSNEGSYSDANGNLVSAFTRDQTLIRVVLHHDLNVRHPEAIAIKTGVAWGG